MIDGFQLGPLYIRFYGIILMLGTLAGGWLATVEVKRRGKDPEMVWDLLIYLIIGGVIGARLWHIFTPAPSSIAQGFTTHYYLTHPLDALAIWKGGLGIPGSIMGGLIALYFYARKYRVFSFVEWTDIAAPSLALGQAIGRWGNFFNQELYGAPTNLPWKIYIDPAHRLAGFENVSYYHPLFAYESILSLLNMLLLLWVIRRFAGRLKRGDIFNLYLIIYPVIRFSLDFLRLDASEVFSVNINQTLSAVVAVGALAFFIWRHWSGAGQAESAESSGGGTSENVSTSRAAATAEPKRRAPRKAAPRKTSAATKNRTASKKSVSKKTASRKSAVKKTVRKTGR